MAEDTLNRKFFFYFILITVTISVLFTASCQKEPVKPNGILPLPHNISMGKGGLPIMEIAEITYNDEKLRDQALFLQKELNKETGTDFPVNYNPVLSDRAINLYYEDGFEEECYKLDILENGVICRASDKAGAFYGIQSLLQSIVMHEELQKFPCMRITDKPQYSWRGFMLDESRHFFGKEVVKQYLDIMARLKLNRFHWHLTDEPGWRIEIKSYPLLTTVGGKGCWSDQEAPVAFYTQEDIKEIVAYAAERNIMVIPEIDMPGHATAASRAYPFLSGGGEGKWNGFTFHPAKESTYEFIDKVMDEIVSLFPAPYIHIGGDEVHYGNQSWFTDPVIQKFIKDNNLGNEQGLEHYFVRRVSDIIHGKGKKMLGWDEIINTGVSPEKTSIMWWRHDKPEVLTQILDSGFEVILCPRIPCYFDFVQDDTHKIGRRWGGNYNTLERVYNFTDSISSLIKDHPQQILGMQANLWTERVKDKQRLDFMIFPRLPGIAENAWSAPEQKSYDYFIERIQGFMKFLDKEGINYFNIFDKTTTPEPWGPEKEDVIAEG